MAEKDNRAVRFDNTLILLPERDGWNHHIPLILGGTIGQITKNEVNAFGVNFLHHFQTITIDNGIGSDVHIASPSFYQIVVLFSYMVYSVKAIISYRIVSANGKSTLIFGYGL